MIHTLLKNSAERLVSPKVKSEATVKSAPVYSAQAMIFLVLKE